VISSNSTHAGILGYCFWLHINVSKEQTASIFSACMHAPRPDYLCPKQNRSENFKSACNCLHVTVLCIAISKCVLHAPSFSIFLTVSS
jgi:hypothetical protein